MSPPTEAQLECERLRDELRESESRNDGLEETIAELTEERDELGSKLNSALDTALEFGNRALAAQDKLMELLGGKPTTDAERLPTQEHDDA